MKELTRKELYDHVWQTPMSKLAREFGLSDVGLAKICKKHDIPRPPRGYWARVASGQRVSRTPMPNPKNDQKIKIKPSCGNSVYNGTHLQHQENQELGIPDIGVAQSLRSPHPLVAKSVELIEVSKEDEDGIVKPRSGALDVKVSRKLVKRALRIMDALIKSIENQSYRVVIRGKETWLKLQSEEVRFSIFEDLDSEKIESTDASFDGYYQFRHKQYEYKKVPSGRLCLTINDIKGYHVYDIRKNWRDTNTKKLEDQITGAFKGIIKLVFKKRANDKEKAEQETKRLERERQREEQERTRKELRIQINEEKERVSRLITDSENRYKSKLIRELVDEVEAQILDQECCYEPAANFESWKEWALNQANRLDPLVESPESILDKEQDLIEDEQGSESKHHYRWNR